jgi:death on curing protein
MFYMINGYQVAAEAGEVIGLTVDAAEGQKGVADIAATLKVWAQQFDTTDEWIEDDGPSHGKHHAT